MILYSVYKILYDTIDSVEVMSLCSCDHVATQTGISVNRCTHTVVILFVLFTLRVAALGFL